MEHTNEPILTQKKQHSASSKRKSTVMILVGIILIAFFVMMKNKSTDGNGGFFGLGGSTGSKTEKSGGASGGAVVAGEFALQTQDGRSVIGVGEEIIVTLHADTAKQEIGGYDAVISYNDEVLEFVEAENLIDSFEMFTKTGPGPGGPGPVLTIASVPSNPGAVVPKIFRKDPVARLTFRAKAPGNATLSFVFEKGATNESNLISLSAQDILHVVKNYNLTVGLGKTLSKGQSLTTPEGLTITLTEIKAPEPQCADCTIDAFIKATYKTDSADLEFSNGGISGVISDTQKALMHNIEVRNITPQSLEVYTAPAQ